MTALDLFPANFDSAFDTFWRNYPRRVARLAAERAYSKALKLATADEILEGVMRYAYQVQGKDPQYIAHAATWLRAGRWMDEPEPQAKAQLRGTDALRDRLRQEIERNEIDGYGDQGSGAVRPLRRLPHITH